MKCKYGYLLLSLMLSIVFYINVINGKAMNTVFTTEELSEEEKTAFMNSIIIIPLKTAPEKRGILQFDVNEQGLIAVRQQKSQEEVCIYTSQGVFLYGYSFKCKGSICVEWDYENINILFVRDNIIVSVDPNGNIIDMKSISSTADNSIYENALHTTRRTVGDTTYLIRNDMGVILNVLTVSFSQIVVTDASGTERIIYDVNTTQLIKKVVFLIFLSTFIAVAIIVIVRQFKKLQHSK